MNKRSTFSEGALKTTLKKLFSEVHFRRQSNRRDPKIEIRTQ